MSNNVLSKFKSLLGFEDYEDYEDYEDEEYERSQLNLLLQIRKITK